MFDSFLHPEFMAIAAALIAAPIIIHLINRLRFKRLRWAAMEFLLKAQKRNRRRLIIEQLLLLALRCLLVALVGVLVMRYVGFAFDPLGSRQALHLVLLDDTLSMYDQVPVGDTTKSTFQVAKKEILIDKIALGVSQTGSNDKLMVLPLSQLATDANFQAQAHERLNDTARMDELKKQVEELQPTQLHVELLRGVKKAREIAQNHPDRQVTLHVLSDFRQRDWGQAEGEALHKELVEAAKHKVKIRLVDTAHPARVISQGGVPRSNDNVGIVDFRPSTHIAGKDMPVTFTLTLANYSSREAVAHVAIFDEKGGEQFQVTQDFNPPLPLKIPASSVMQASFDYRFAPALKPGEPYFAQLSAHLESAQRGKLENDGLPHDNIRYAAVEIRDQVPILVVDGEARAGREDDRKGLDSLYLKTALVSVPGSSYRVEFGDLLGGAAGVAPKALERADLSTFPTIFLLNVREFTPKQIANLETFVREGGGLAFFLGPQVSVPHYNKHLYKEGQGLFPAALKDPYYPKQSDPEIEALPTGAPMLLLRDDLFPSLNAYPIFGQVFKETGLRSLLTYLPTRRYFQVAQTPWRTGKAQVSELATLPNDREANKYDNAVLNNIGKGIDKVLENKEFDKYRIGLDRYRTALKNVVRPTSEQKAHELAVILEDMLKDRGKEKERTAFPNLMDFWSDSDPKVRSLKKDVEELRDQVRYGDPYMLTKTFGKGKVVAVMSTAGKLWNDWQNTVVYEPFIYETQIYLSSLASDANLSVGTPVEIKVDAEPFKQGNSRVAVKRFFHKVEPVKGGEPKLDNEQTGAEKDGYFRFSYDGNREPGLYVAHLLAEDSGEKKLASWGHVFNVDTDREGPLQRVSQDDLKSNILDKAEGMVSFESTSVSPDDLVPRRSDLSESPLFFLLFLAVLVAEQALAVHLSFHLRGSEGDTLAQVTQVKHAA